MPHGDEDTSAKRQSDPELRRHVQDQVRAGRYQKENEVVRDTRLARGFGRSGVSSRIGG
jgi:hypothetical protein